MFKTQLNTFSKNQTHGDLTKRLMRREEGIVAAAHPVVFDDVKALEIESALTVQMAGMPLAPVLNDDEMTNTTDLPYVLTGTESTGSCNSRSKNNFCTRQKFGWLY